MFAAPRFYLSSSTMHRTTGQLSTGAKPLGQAKRRRPVTPTSPDASGIDNGTLLSAIEQINSKMDKFSERIDDMENKLIRKFKEFEHRFAEIGDALDFQNKVVEEIQTELPRMEKKLKTDLQDAYMEIDKVAAYATRENIVILGVPELSENENTEEVVRDFYKTKLKIGDGERIEHQRLHRIPSAQKPRPIKVRFFRYDDKVKIMNHAKNLKGTSYFITDDLPKRNRQMRKEQMEQMKKAREMGKIAFFSRSEPWKLVIKDAKGGKDGASRSGERPPRSSKLADERSREVMPSIPATSGAQLNREDWPTLKVTRDHGRQGTYPRRAEATGDQERKGEENRRETSGQTEAAGNSTEERRDVDEMEGVLEEP